MDNSFEFPYYNPADEPEIPKVTPIKDKAPTKDEFEQAADELFQEIYHGHWRALHESSTGKNTNR